MNVNHLRSAFQLVLTWYTDRENFDTKFKEETSKISEDEIVTYCACVAEMIHKTSECIKNNK